MPSSNSSRARESSLDSHSSGKYFSDIRVTCSSMSHCTSLSTPGCRSTSRRVPQSPPAHPVVFTGSSSVRMWTSLAAEFPLQPVLNRGFGGSQLRDAIWHADQVAVRYQPRRIVLYAGDNDIDAGRTPEQVRDDFRAFVARIRRDLPDVPIARLAIKPSLDRKSTRLNSSH